jgi:hypothetical protein
MKKYIVIQQNSFLTGVAQSFNNLEDAQEYADIMSRNVETLSSGKPMWNYFVFQMV